MTLNTSQGEIKIELSNCDSRIGVKLSGGLDSAIIFYMLCKYAKEERPDITIVPITIQVLAKPYNLHFTKLIIDFCKRMFPSVNIAKQETRISPIGVDFNIIQNELLSDLKKK